MVILLNGPLGIGKSTLTEALGETMDECVMLDGDHLIATNPPPNDEVDYLHTILAMLIGHHRTFGYRHFVINHMWRHPEDLEDLRRRIRRIDSTVDIATFMLTLPLEENLRRIERRQIARAIDEREFERRTVHEERRVLSEVGSGELGEAFDVSGSTDVLVRKLLVRVGYLSGAA